MKERQLLGRRVSVGRTKAGNEINIKTYACTIMSVKPIMYNLYVEINFRKQLNLLRKIWIFPFFKNYFVYELTIVLLQNARKLLLSCVLFLKGLVVVLSSCVLLLVVCSLFCAWCSCDPRKCSRFSGVVFEVDSAKSCFWLFGGLLVKQPLGALSGSFHSLDTDNKRTSSKLWD